MMSKFIEVHDKHTNDFMPKDWKFDDRLYVNVDDISLFSKDGLWLRNSSKIDCQESYHELKQLIQDAGILIHKPDPRLNLTKPLSIEDLSGMIGEPVWNSNNNQWLIMAHYLDNKENPIAGLYNKNGYLVEFTADDLIRTPLYRMKQEVK